MVFVVIFVNVDCAGIKPFGNSVAERVCDSRFSIDVCKLLFESGYVRDALLMSGSVQAL